MTRPVLLCALIGMFLLPLAASAGPYDIIFVDRIDFTGGGFTLAGLDYGLIVNTGTTNITVEDLRNAQVTATSSHPDFVMYPFINIPNEQIVGVIHPGEAVGSLVPGNEMLVPLVKPGETIRNLGAGFEWGVQFMAYQIDRRGPYVGPVDFHVRMVLTGQMTEFTIHAEARLGEFALRFLSADRVSSGPANGEPDCSGVTASRTLLWPPNGDLVPIDLMGATDPEGDPVRIVVTGVSQDEPVGEGGANHGRGGRQTAPADSGETPGSGGRRCPDAQIVDGRAFLRAERDASGNGRVYSIQFDAIDSHGGMCRDTVAVCVPHDRGHGGECVDDGQVFNSLECPGDGGDSTAVAVMKPRLPMAMPAGPALITNTMIQDGRQIRYSLLKDSVVEIELYDVSGRRIATLDQGTRTAGEHSVKWEEHAGPKGVYFVRMRVDGQSQPGVMRVRN